MHCHKILVYPLYFVCCVLLKFKISMQRGTLLFVEKDLGVVKDMGVSRQHSCRQCKEKLIEFSVVFVGG